MYLIRVLVISVLMTESWSAGYQKFPPEFLFGAATAAYQVEGAWNVSDKSENIWDHMVHTRPELTSGETGDVACDSYRLWRRDIEMCQELGLNIYRISISWTRLLPTGFPNIISEDGKNYYNNLIDGLLEKGIEPMVTIYHFDLPQSLQDLGGWANPLISDWFADYARVVYSLFADRVKYWVTINEPAAVCEFGYEMKGAPYLNDTYVGKYLCNKYIMIAHAKAWRIYDEEYKPLYKGKVSLATIFVWFIPKTPDDVERAQLSSEHWEGRYAHPVFSKKGGWPPAIEKFINDKAKQEGYPYPRLLPFSPEEIELVRGTYDFYGLNHYITRSVRKAKPGEIGVWPFYGSEELGVMMDTEPNWTVGALTWFSIEPTSLRKQMHWLNETYGVTDVFITENGYVDENFGLEDWVRLKLLKEFLEQALLSIQDGFNVMGYVAWTLMDNFEWMGGYKINFGLYAVDFADENKTRTPRKSALYYSSVTRTRQIDDINTALK